MILDWLCSTEERAKWIVGPHPRDPVLAEILGLAAETSSGIHVDRNAALSYAPVFRGVNLIARGVAKLPLNVMRGDENQREKAKEHPAYRLMRRKPNQYMTAVTFWKTLMGHALLEGNGYAYITRDGAGRPRELLILNPDSTYPVRYNGVLWYVTKFVVDGVQEERRLRPEDVLHIKGLGFDGLTGYSLIALARESFGLGLAAQKYGSVFFKNGARMSGVLQYPGHMDEEEADRVRKSWEKKTVGLDQKAKIAILEEGVKFQSLTIPQEEAQFLQTREFELRAGVANWLCLPPHKLGDSTRTSYNSLEQEEQAFLNEALDPWLVDIEQECTDKLLTEEEKESESHFVEFNRDALVQVDYKTKREGLGIEIQHGVTSPDEARRILGRGPRDDRQGGRYWMPSNMQYADAEQQAAGSGQPAAEEQQAADSGQQAAEDDAQEDAGGARARLHFAHWNLLLDAGRRACRRVAAHARKAAGKPERFLEAATALESEHRAVVMEILSPAVTAWTELHRGARARPGPIVSDLFGEARRELIELAGQVTDGDLAARVDQWAAELERVGPQRLVQSIITRSPEDEA